MNLMQSHLYVPIMDLSYILDYEYEWKKYVLILY